MLPTSTSTRRQHRPKLPNAERDGMEECKKNSLRQQPGLVFRRREVCHPGGRRRAFQRQEQALKQLRKVPTCSENGWNFRANVGETKRRKHPKKGVTKRQAGPSGHQGTSEDFRQDIALGGFRMTTLVATGE